MYKNLKNVLFTAIVIATVFATTTGCSLVKDPKAKMKPELLKPEERKFQKYEVKTGSVRYEHGFTGKTTSKTSININSSLTGGMMEKVYVKTWTNVKKGDVIAKYYTKDIDNKIEIQQIAVKERESELEMVKKENNQDRTKKAELSLQREQTILRQLNDQREACIFRSPIDGVVSALNKATSGSMVGINEIIATVIDTSSILVTVEPEDKELKKYYVGMKCEINYDNKTYNGEVKEITTIDKEEFRTKRGAILEFKDEIPKDLKVASTVTYKVFGEEKTNVIIIPVGFLKTDDLGNMYVYVIKDDIREKRIIDIGISNTSFTEVKSGLEVGETIILN